MEKHIEEWVEQNSLEEEILKENQELSLDGKEWPDHKISKADWGMLIKKCPKLIGFGAVNGNVQTIEEPEEAMDQIEVLDLSENKLDTLDFLCKFPNLVSLSCAGEKQKFEKSDDILNALKKVPNLNILEVQIPKDVPEDNEEKLEEFFKKVFDVCPNLKGLNGFDEEGNELQMDDMEEFNEEDFDLFAENGEFLEDEAAEEEADGSDDAEPPTKKARTE